MNLLDLIPYGHENAVSRAELKQKSGLSDRVMRAKLTALRQEHAILNMQDNRGYFRPLPDEYPLVRVWMGQTRSRAKECECSLNGARKWLLAQQSQILDGQLEFTDARGQADG